MADGPTRTAEFARLRELGVVDVKIDFFGENARAFVRLCRDILEHAAAEGLLENLHVATLPLGVQLDLHELDHDLRGFGPRRLAVRAGVDRLEHRGRRSDLRRWNQAPHVAVKIDRAALVGALGIKLGEALDQTEALVTDKQPHSL